MTSPRLRYRTAGTLASAASLAACTAVLAAPTAAHAAAPVASLLDTLAPVTTPITAPVDALLPEPVVQPTVDAVASSADQAVADTGAAAAQIVQPAPVVGEPVAQAVISATTTSLPIPATAAVVGDTARNDPNEPATTPTSPANVPAAAPMALGSATSTPGRPSPTSSPTSTRPPVRESTPVLATSTGAPAPASTAARGTAGATRHDATPRDPRAALDRPVTPLVSPNDRAASAAPVAPAAIAEFSSTTPQRPAGLAPVTLREDHARAPPAREIPVRPD